MVRVENKRDMYTRLLAGEFGNTLPQWFDIRDWLLDPQGYKKYERWGVRSLTANDPRARLDVPRDEVAPWIVTTGLVNDGYQLSAMVDQAGSVQAELQVMKGSEPGLYVEGNLAPIAGNGQWRNHMRTPRVWEGTRGDVLLRSLLNDNSYDDVRGLLDLYPDHVVEFTVLDVCMGTVPGRNAVVWEVRSY